MRITKKGRLDKRFKGSYESEGTGFLILFFCSPIYLVIYLSSILISGYEGFMPSSSYLIDFILNVNFDDNRGALITAGVSLLFYIYLFISFRDEIKELIITPMINSYVVLYSCFVAYKLYTILFASDILFKDTLNFILNPDGINYWRLVMFYFTLFILSSVLLLRRFVKRSRSNTEYEKNSKSKKLSESLKEMQRRHEVKPKKSMAQELIGIDKVTLTNEKDLFLDRYNPEFSTDTALSLAIRAAVQHNSLYDKSTTVKQRKEIRDYWSGLLINISEKYQESKISDVIYESDIVQLKSKMNIKFNQYFLSETHSKFGYNPGFRISHSQKSISVYLKHL